MGKKYNTKIKIIILIGLFAIALFYYRNATFTTAGDDEVYRTSIETWGVMGELGESVLFWKQWKNYNT